MILTLLKKWRKSQKKEKVCNGIIKNKSKVKKDLKIRIPIRKVERPNYEQLLIDINTLGYCGTGRKYGVSDNSIRKWKKYYEKII